MKIPFKKSKRSFISSLLCFMAAFFCLWLVFQFIRDRNGIIEHFFTLFWTFAFIYHLVIGFIYLNINKRTFIFISDELISVRYVLNKKKEIKFKDIKQMKIIKDKFLVLKSEDKKELKINLDLIENKNTERLKSILESKSLIFN